MFAKPESDRLSSAYRRLVAGDAGAPDELAQLTLEPLTKVLRVGMRGTRDADMAHDAAVDAIIDILRAPGIYAQAQSSLWSFLEMAGRRNLANLRLGEKRRDERIARFRKNVALCPPARNKYEEGMLDRLVESEAVGAFWRRVNGVVDFLALTDVEMLMLMISGVRATAEYGRLLGIAATPPDEQRRAVKRAKDRLRKRMKRWLRSATGT